MIFFCETNIIPHNIHKYSHLSIQLGIFSVPHITIMDMNNVMIAICMCNSLKCRCKHPLPYNGARGGGSL